MTTDTIAAVATPTGQGGIGVVRVSGPKVAAVAAAIVGHLPAARIAKFQRFYDAEQNLIDEGLALYFPAPKSFTGEDVLELHGHGGPVVMDLLLQAVLQQGARMARPGEFSERAFLNDKIDLAQAEAIADLISSSTAVAVRAAVASLQGVFSQHINLLVEQLIALRMYVEAAIDFPEEEIDFLSDGRIAAKLQKLRQQFAELLAEARQGQLLRDGMTIVIAGHPNAGKSSLLNQLAGTERAIVTAIPGTTRDVLREQINIDGMPLHVIDTAGLRDSDDLVEQEGIRRAWQEIENADRLLLVVDTQKQQIVELNRPLPEHLAVTTVHNKIDLTGESAHTEDNNVWLSAKTGAGLGLLRQHLKDCMGYHIGEGRFTARRRHLAALEQAAEHLQQANYQLEVMQAGELIAEELRLAQHAVGEITGEFTSDDLLGRIFSTFCIGK